MVDEADAWFGFRTLSWSTRGFFVNGKKTLFRGACVHHDNGILGACSFEDAEFRRVRLLKEAGFNAIRSAHNPASKALLDACDRLGLYVMDEFCDNWLVHKNPYDYADRDFRAWWQQDLTAMVIKNYNHPSVVMNSIGNEISELAMPEGQEYCKKLGSPGTKAGPGQSSDDGGQPDAVQYVGQGRRHIRQQKEWERESKRQSDDGQRSHQRLLQHADEPGPGV